MKKNNKMNVAALLYMLSSIIWLAAAVMNFIKGQIVYGVLYIALTILCVVFAKRKM